MAVTNHARTYRDRIINALELHNYSRAKAAHEVGISTQKMRDAVRKLKKQGMDVPDNPEFGPMYVRQKADDPTPEEIAVQCAEIRQGWNGERLRRYQSPPVEMQTARVVCTQGRNVVYEIE